jgi:acylglycerol lipase
MPHADEFFLSADGLSLYQQSWLPDGECRAVVAVIHGFTEYSGRYARLASDLNAHGHAVYSIDLRGHGRSAGARAWISAFDEYLDDVEALLKRVSERQAGKPLFLFGHSMGGLILAQFAIDRRPHAAGLIFSSPAILMGKKAFPILRRLAPWLGAVWPRMRLVRMGYRNISRDQKIVQEFGHDPLVFHGRFPVRTGMEILSAASDVRQRLEEIRLPLLVIHGTGDLAADAAGSRLLYARASSADKTLRLYDGMYHEVFSDPERQKAVDDLVEWLDARAR